ncbi:YfbM family protein [Prosthecodimorpha staleyi]|uniref:YfbM family protein n=1 Tax=Prosthecodimorpha staleyi TaxID=2840188 RepID=A0A947GHX0_9HYPH|nr:YfbM family protein [Prosthecodimorpha staleyi]MBT9288229.1 YfbM family protein [Prosthecodimorpha staleyi]
MGFEVTLRAMPVAAAAGLAELSPDDDGTFEILAAIEGGARLTCSLDRRFDWLRFVLAGLIGPQMAEAAVFGQAVVAPGLRASQGFAYRWNDGPAVAAIAASLDRLDPTAVRRAVDLPAMAAAGVYKIGQADAAVLPAGVAADFAALQGFYRQTVARGLAVLVTRD